jgi:hypothetical protein
MKFFIIAALLFTSSLFAQTNTAHSSEADPLKALSFLEGTWEGKTGSGSAGAQVTGTYTFQRELRNHTLARHTNSIGACKGPAAFDCEHSDLLYVYQDAGGQSLKALFLDNEGHVIHYDVSTPSPTTAVFLSNSSQPGPQFRLLYELKDQIMSGKFQMRMPGQEEWKSYLEWSGGKHM